MSARDESVDHITRLKRISSFALTRPRTASASLMEALSQTLGADFALFPSFFLPLIFPAEREAPRSPCEWRAAAVCLLIRMLRLLVHIAVHIDGGVCPQRSLPRRATLIDKGPPPPPFSFSHSHTFLVPASYYHQGPLKASGGNISLGISKHSCPLMASLNVQ